MPYRVAARGAVRVAVYDALGREVAVLADGPHGPGAHVAALAGGALAPGAYVVRLTAPGRAPEARPLTILR